MSVWYNGCTDFFVFLSISSLIKIRHISETIVNNNLFKLFYLRLASLLLAFGLFGIIFTKMEAYMKAVELSKVYNPKDFEEKIYSQWKEKGEFCPKDGDGHFSIVMPPPNVTGILHMGHALNNNLQDIIIRYKRMLGIPALWVPGTDHAGIATQNVVERQLAKEGLSRHDLGRDKFLERTWKVKEKHHDIIKKQLETMGCSCDWNHERFTMDEGL